MKVRTEFVWFMTQTAVGSCEHGNGPSGSMKGEELPDQLRDYQILTGDFAPCSDVSVARTNRLSLGLT